MLHYLEITNNQMLILTTCLDDDKNGRGFRNGMSIGWVGNELKITTTTGKNATVFTMDHENLSQELIDRICGQLIRLPKYSKNRKYRLSVNPDYLDGGVFWEILHLSGRSEKVTKTVNEKAEFLDDRSITDSIRDVIVGVNDQEITYRFRIDTALLPPDRKITFNLSDDPTKPIKITQISENLDIYESEKCEFVVMPIKLLNPVE